MRKRDEIVKISNETTTKRLKLNANVVGKLEAFAKTEK
jgi:hypothetical protein